MATREVTPPAGFILEENQNNPTPPPGFILEENNQLDTTRGKGYLTRVGEDWSNRAKNINAEFDAPHNPNLEGFGGKVLRIAGNAAGAIGDPLAEAVTSAYRTVMPDKAQASISESMKEVLKDPKYKPFLEGLAKYAKEHPESLSNVESILNLLTLKQVTQAYSGAAKTAGNVAVKTANRVLPEGTALKMYTSAVKPGTNVKKGMESISEEMKYSLDKGMMPSQKGLDILYKDIAKNTAEKNAAIAAHPNVRISASDDAMRYIPQLLDEWSGPAGKSKLPKDSRNIIIKAAEKFFDQNNASGRGMSLQKVDNMKTQIYKDQKLYAPGVTRPRAEIEEFNKQLARGLKDSLYDSVMDTHPNLRLLGEDSKLMIDLKNTFEAAAQRIGRRDLMGIGLPIKTGVGSVVGKVTGLDGLGTTVGIIAGVLDVPTVKAKLAIALNRANKKAIISGFENASPGVLGIRAVTPTLDQQEN